MFRFLCMCPVYGTPPHLIEESIQCFLDQTHTDALLYILDDLGTLRNCKYNHPRVLIKTIDQRCPSLPDKYNYILSYLTQKHRPNAVAWWEVDDLYLYNHLEEHAKILATNDYSYPERVWSTYPQYPVVEASGGRFWASAAIRSKAMIETGLVLTHEASFDQQSLKRFLQLKHAAGPPTYCFRWADTNATHGQAGMKSASDTTWYDLYEPYYTLPIENLTPGYRTKTQKTLEDIYVRIHNGETKVDVLPVS